MQCRSKRSPDSAPEYATIPVFLFISFFVKLGVAFPGAKAEDLWRYLDSPEFLCVLRSRSSLQQ